MVLLSVVLSACANMGSPDGGDYDYDPPVLLKTSPAPNTVNYKDKKVELTFDEFVKVTNMGEKVIISPPQLEPPRITSQPTKKISITLQEELKPNTTYTIDFSDAIVDNNEENPFGSYAFTFSTGASIDTFQVSGYVLAAENLDPVKGIYVGAYPLEEGQAAHSDSAFYKTKLPRVSRTDEKGYFCIRGLAEQNYQIVALLDGDQNFLFNQKSEQIAFLSDSVRPSAIKATRADTLWADTLTVDTILYAPYTRFLPDHLLLRAFKEDATMLYFRKAERLHPNRFQIYFSSPSPGLPRIKGLNFDADSAFTLEKSLHNDTLTYWLRDTLLCQTDTLQIALEYLQTDSTNALSYTTDTLDLPIRRRVSANFDPKAAAEKDKKKKNKKKKGEEDEEEEPIINFLPVRIQPGSRMDIQNNISLTFDEPIRGIDPKHVHLAEQKPKDTLFHAKPFLLRQDTLNPRRFEVLAEWNPGYTYHLQVDSGSIHSIYGTFINRIDQKFLMRTEDEYASLSFQIAGMPDSAAYVELLTEQEKVVRSTPVERGRATFYFVKPAKYYARLISDRNNNGKWDTGLYPTLQPEQVFYYPRQLELRALWDTEEDWNLQSLPIDRQKPEKLKPRSTQKKQRQPRNRNTRR